ncbi:MAG TPA: aquaporin, partial [Candidatus Norongarragalinales archaeon]|nr:aquaporin [Candidatus Norongarragalinales archaeon]
PAVTAGLWLAKKINGKDAVFYVGWQLLGAAVAGLLLSVLFPTAPAHLGTPDLGNGIGFLRGIGIEAILTFFLVFVVLNVAVDRRAPAGVYGGAIGLVLVFDILFGGPLTGAAMNPARAFGPALASGYWVNQLVYWIGPLLGAIVASLAYTHLLAEKRKTTF